MKVIIAQNFITQFKKKMRSVFYSIRIYPPSGNTQIFSASVSKICYTNSLVLNKYICSARKEDDIDKNDI